MKNTGATLLVFAGLAQALAAGSLTLPAGTDLEVRLSAPSGSGFSRVGDPLNATLIAPILSEGQLAVPQGATVSGKIQYVQRLGFGIKHPTAALQFHMDALHLPGGVSVPIQTRLLSVEAAKERVASDGTLGGIYPTANLSSTVSFYLLPLLCVEPELGIPVLSVKFLIARSPDAEIYLPAGTELILRLEAPAEVPNPVEPRRDPLPRLSPADLTRAEKLLKELPEQRTNRGRNHPSDLVNILFLGSRDEINRAFRASGWSGSQPRSLVTIYRMYHCMVQRIGYTSAPMGRLTLNGLTPDAEYQKGLDTFSKRHHLRLWRQEQNDAQQGNGAFEREEARDRNQAPRERDDAWFSAATEDVGYAMRRMHLTHATDAAIDNERNKVLNDLAFTGCVHSAQEIRRDLHYPATSREPSLQTDGKLVALRLNSCKEPRNMPGVPGGLESVSTRHQGGRAWTAFRNDLIRSNPVTIGYETAGLFKGRQSSQVAGGSPMHPKTTQRAALLHWTRPSIIQASVSAQPSPLTACALTCIAQSGQK